MINFGEKLKTEALIMNNYGQRLKLTASILYVVLFFLTVIASFVIAKKSEPYVDYYDSLVFLIVLVVGIVTSSISCRILYNIGDHLDQLCQTVEDHSKKYEELRNAIQEIQENTQSASAKPETPDKPIETNIASDPQSDTIACPYCGAKNPKYQFCCIQCGEILI